MRPNTVYISSLLKERYPHAASELLSILKRHNVSVKELTGTKDVWCRDYMPVLNRKGELIQFKYAPSYLRDKKYEGTRSNVHDVCEANGIKPDRFSSINLDGGNVVLYGDKAIITDRIFKENLDCDKEKLVSDLAELLDAKIIIIKSYNSESEDFTGHADGMVRFVDEHTILCNDLDKDYKYIGESIKKVCRDNGLTYKNIPFFTPKYDKNNPDSALGIYVNYLEVNDLIVLPQFNIDGNYDKEVVQIFSKIFPNRIIETIDYNEVALDGGLLNCTTWTVNE